MRSARAQPAPAPAVNLTVAAPQAPDVHVVNHAARPTHAEVRRDLWVQVAVAVARSDNCTKPSSMASFADEALREFDKRFPA